MSQLIEIRKNVINDQEIQTVNARELHSYLEIGKDFSSWIKDRIDQYDFVENQDFVVFTNSGENLKGGRPAKEYALTIDMAKELSMVERNEKGKQARRYFIECERRAKANVSIAPQSLPEALRLAADLAEQKLIAQQERDHAIRTKAEIGSRREATAMNTASQAIKRASKLETELDQSKQYATIKRMEMLYHGQKFKWQILKNTAIEMEMLPISVFDANYGKVNSYHADVWREAYAIEIIEGVA